MQIQSTRFGQLEISHSDLIFMPHGLIGFEEYRHWVLLSSKESEELAWFQSVALSHVALPMISPRRFVPNYRLQVQRRDLDLLQMHAKDQVYVLATLSKQGNHWTTNLKSPVILNSTRRLAVQVIVIDDQPLSQPIILTDVQELQKAA
ncbi:MAG: flagellar assembly protein FliW [Planctomycetota bacterium]|jgi:flagellar assembly factor FliW|nr:flagellar assembly protein FliW [Planctomycetota bacterium]